MSVIQPEDYTAEDERLAREHLHRLERIRWERDCREDLTAWAIEALGPRAQTPARHHQLLLDNLAAVERGEIDRLMVCMPPGHAKSTYTSVVFPPWYFAQSSFRDIIGASHVSKLAESFSKKIHSLIRQNERVLGYRLASEGAEEWQTTNGGFYRAAGVGGSITGRRADLIIIDDPVKGAKDAESPTSRETVWEWYQAEVYTRLKPGGAIIVVMTRWNEDDLGGRLLADQETGADHWRLIEFPALADSIDDPLGRAIGVALWPEYRDEVQLQRIKRVAGPYVWGALFQQKPKPRGSSFFTQEMLLIGRPTEILDLEGKPILAYEPAPMPTRCDTVFATVDTAIKAGTEHNSTAVTFWAYNSLLPICSLIIDWDIIQIIGADQADWLPTVHARGEELAQYCGARFGYVGAIIEDKATGTVLIQQSQNEAAKMHRAALARAIDSKLTAMGKEERAIAAAPYVIDDMVKITTEAFEKTKVHKGHSANYQIKQVTDFRLGAQQKDGLDLLDTFCYGVLMTCAPNAGKRKGI